MIAGIRSEYLPLLELYSPSVPEAFADFSNARSLRRIAGVSQACGTEFTKVYDYSFAISRLDHSVGVGLIVWNFTHRVDAALSGLFHDVSHSVFSHVGDFLLGDVETQEASEGSAPDPFENDSVVDAAMAKNSVGLEDFRDYSVHSIADLPGPRLAADRLEYTLGTPIIYGTRSFEEIAQIYRDITVLTAEDGQLELGFRTPETAEKLALLSIENDSAIFSSIKSTYTMSALSRIVGTAVERGLLTVPDLYRLTDAEAVSIFCRDAELASRWADFQKIRGLEVVAEPPSDGTLAVEWRCKKRFIDPLAVTSEGVGRVSSFSERFRKAKEAHLNTKGGYIVERD